MKLNDMLFVIAHRQEAVSKVGDIPAGSLGETIDRAMEIYKCRIDGSGGHNRRQSIQH